MEERPAENGEVLREHVNKPSIDAAEAGNEAVAGRTLLLHTEIDAAMTDKFVQLFEGAFVQQKVDALARGELSGLLFALAPLLSSTGFGFPGNGAKLFHPAVVF